MARTFTSASGHKIIAALGQLGFAFGPGTVAAIIRPSSVGTAGTAFSAGATNGASWMLQIGPNVVSLRLNGIEVHGAATMSANNWYLIAAAKATGTATPRVHLYDYATGTWTHENASGTLANSSTPVTQAQIGCTPAGAAFFPGDIAACGAWNVVLTDSQVEALAHYMSAWFVVQPKGFFILDQAATSMKTNDLSGGGANESSITGTAVSANSVPGFSYAARPFFVPSTAANAFALDANPGSYTLTGVLAGVPAGRMVVSDPGSYALTGSTATQLADRTLSGSPGSYSLTGMDLTMLLDRLFPVDAGSYVLTGLDAQLPADRLFPIDPGAYIITGDPAAIVAGRAVSADPGSYAITGAAATFLVGYAFQVEPGVYAVTGEDTDLLADRILALEPGAYIITGLAAEIALPGAFALLADPGAYAVSGSIAAVLATRLLVTEVGVFAVTGLDAAFLRTLVASLGPGAYLIDGASTALVLAGRERRVTAERTRVEGVSGRTTTEGSRGVTRLGRD